ncbi:hypothetical protein J2Y63_005578 [Shinella sp. BE166]|uniref:hypothetical protein n=1 Tax=Shinella sp. BE166 TaxID=3373918 RepID=UPI003EB9CE5B
MTDFRAEEAGKALGVIAEKLHLAGILTQEGRSALSDESKNIIKQKRSKSWSLEIKPARPISFSRAKDKHGNDIQLNLISKIKVDQIDELHAPFESLDIALEMFDRAGDPIGRWHVDRANAGQSGPTYHLQFGGHARGHRSTDFPVQEPRWCHPPMEIALLCEVISANFFEALWKKHLRDDPAWCKSIQLFQQLCFEAYAKILADCLRVGQSTALGSMWGDRWVRKPKK